MAIRPEDLFSQPSDAELGLDLSSADEEVDNKVAAEAAAQYQECQSILAEDFEYNGKFYGLSHEKIVDFIDQECNGHKNKALTKLINIYLDEIKRRKLDYIQYRVDSITALDARMDYKKIQKYADHRLVYGGEPYTYKAGKATDPYFGELRANTAKKKYQAQAKDVFSFPDGKAHPRLRLYVQRIIKKAINSINKPKKENALFSDVINLTEQNNVVQRWPTDRTIDALYHIQDHYGMDVYKSIYNTYDPFFGWGDRPLALTAAGFNVIANDLNPELPEKCVEMHQAYRDPYKPTYLVALNKPAQYVLPKDFGPLGHCQLVHTGMPYYDLEQYDTPDNKSGNQSAMNYTTWFEEVVVGSLNSAMQMLAPGGILSLNVGTCGTHEIHQDLLNITNEMPELQDQHIWTMSGRKGGNVGRKEVYFIVAQRKPLLHYDANFSYWEIPSYPDNFPPLPKVENPTLLVPTFQPGIGFPVNANLIKPKVDLTLGTEVCSYPDSPCSGATLEETVLSDGTVFAPWTVAPDSPELVLEYGSVNTFANTGGSNCNNFVESPRSETNDTVELVLEYGSVNTGDCNNFVESPRTVAPDSPCSGATFEETVLSHGSVFGFASAPPNTGLSYPSTQGHFTHYNKYDADGDAIMGTPESTPRANAEKFSFL